jgi:pyrroline-5-carboxylate reductase
VTSQALQDRRVGFIGAGAMARALAGGLRSAGIPAERLRGADPDTGALKRFQEETLAQAANDNAALVADSDVVVLAVKPALAVSVLEQLDARTDLTRPLWISIAAGVRIELLAGSLPRGARIVRAMPNTPALVGAGATAFCGNASAREDDLEAAQALFDAVGVTWRAGQEAQLDAVTGLSGSGPAYVFLVLEALGDAGVRAGLPRDAAYRLAFQTVYGAARLALETGTHPATLKDQVTSPGGTTIAGLERLEACGVRSAFYEAVTAATARSVELAEEAEAPRRGQN